MKRKICLIETDDTTRSLLKEALTREGYLVQDYPNAYPLFDVNRQWPDLFLVDIDLGSINGLELCRWIKTQEETEYIPVVLICGSPELEVLASDARADGCITKPIDLGVLLKMLDHAQHLTVL